ncbi:Rz1-like lysis system protein LysC [Pseudoalteromonas prydzensis]|uniref:Rz1-like lysis system protein LysC n=1 Tax=Pseudoalteromonas prydzensis TaxID=182141 RepID=UPI003FCC9F56
MKQLRTGLMIACLALLSACSSTQELEPVVRTVVQTKYEFVLMPNEFIQPCNVSAHVVGDNASHSQYTVYLESVIDICNKQLRKARDWNNANRD